MRLLAHLLMKLFVLIVQSSVSYLFEMTICTDYMSCQLSVIGAGRVYEIYHFYRRCW